MKMCIELLMNGTNHPDTFKLNLFDDGGFWW